jgi:hypothetical protein
LIALGRAADDAPAEAARIWTARQVAIGHNPETAP